MKNKAKEKKNEIEAIMCVRTCKMHPLIDS